MPALCNVQPSSVQPRVTSPCREHSLITSCWMNVCIMPLSTMNQNDQMKMCLFVGFDIWSTCILFLGLDHWFLCKKTQPYFWPVPYYQHWTWNMDTNVPTRPSCVSSVHGDIFSAVTAARRNHLNIWTLLVTAMAMNATIKYKYPIKVTRRIKMYPAVCLEEIITLVTAWLVARASNESSRRFQNHGEGPY